MIAAGRRNLLGSFAPGCLVAVLAVSGCAIQPNDYTLPGQTAVGDDGYTVTVHFDQIENLVPNSTVQKDNVVIGTVAAIDTEDWEAVVELRLLRDAPLASDAVFSIGQKTLLGAQYVDVASPADSRRPSGKFLEDGDVVPVAQTGAYPATEQVLGAVALLLNNGGLSQISTITSQVSKAFEGRVPDTRGLIRRTNQLLAVLDSNRDQVVRAIDSLDAVSSGLRTDQSQVVDAVARITPALRLLERERRRLVGAVTDAGQTSTRAVGVIQASRSALLANLDAVGPILSNLGKVSQSLPEALKLGLSIPFPITTTRNAIKGDFTNLFTTFDLRGSSLAASWLGGVPPQLQAGDPVQDPLRPPVSRGTDTRHGDLGDALDDVLNNLHLGPRGQSTSQDQDSDGHRGCLLSLLGVC